MQYLVLGIRYFSAASVCAMRSLLLLVDRPFRFPLCLYVPLHRSIKNYEVIKERCRDMLDI